MQAWKNFLEVQQEELGTETVNKWLRPLKIVSFDAGNLYLEAKDTFQVMWFEEHMRKKVDVQLVNNNKRRIKVHLRVVNAPSQKKGEKKVKGNLEDSHKFTLHFDQLDPNCTLSNFVVFESNLVVHKILTQLCTDNTVLAAVNPIYIHGCSGTGKTHLLMGCAAAFMKNGLRVIYTNAQTFTDHVVAAIRAGEMSLFRQAYRNNDVMIIDDVHVFSRKGATQEEFFHTFNTLHLDNKQIILAANCAPADLKMIEPRLTSRFEWGLVHGIEMPVTAELHEILKTKAQALQFDLTQKLSDYLIASFSTPKMIIKALETLVLRAHLDGIKGPLSLLMAAGMLEGLLAEEKENSLTAQGIIQGAAEHFGLRSEDITGKAQTRECVLPRQISMHLCRHQLKLPFVKIAEIFNKDHSTVMTSVKVIQKSIDQKEDEIAGAYRVIMKRLRP